MSLPREEAGRSDYSSCDEEQKGGRRRNNICNMCILRTHTPRADDLKRYAVSTLNKCNEFIMVPAVAKQIIIIFSRKR